MNCGATIAITVTASLQAANQKTIKKRQEKAPCNLLAKLH